MDTEGFIRNVNTKRESKLEKAAFLQIEALLSRASVLDVDTLAYICLLLEEQLSRHPSHSWVFRLRLNKLKYNFGVFKQYQHNLSRLDLLYRTVRHIQDFIVDTIRLYGEHIRTVDRIYNNANKHEVESFTEKLQYIQPDRIPEWGIKIPIKALLHEQIPDIENTVYRIALPSIADTRYKLKILPSLNLEESIHAQNIVYEIQAMYCDINVHWARRYSSAHQLTEYPLKCIDAIQSLDEIDEEAKEIVIRYVEQMLYFNPYGVMVNIKEVLNILGRELEAWLALSQKWNK